MGNNFTLFKDFGPAYAADPSVTVWLRWFSSALINNGWREWALSRLLYVKLLTFLPSADLKSELETSELVQEFQLLDFCAFVIFLAF